VAAIVAGVLLVVSDLLRLYIVNFAGGEAINRIYVVDGWIGVFLAVMVQLGLFGVYAPRAKALGIIGLVGLLVASIGVQLAMGASFAFAFSRPDVWPWQTTEYFEEPLPSILRLGLSFSLGCVLLGVGMFRARVYARAATALFIIGALILLTPMALNDVIFGAGIAWLGYEIFSDRSEEAL
jgi:hypothetical protein